MNSSFHRLKSLETRYSPRREWIPSADSTRDTFGFPNPSKLATKVQFPTFKIALRPSSIPAKVSNFRNFSVSGKERARERKVGLRNSKSFLSRKDSLATCKAAKWFCKIADWQKGIVKELHFGITYIILQFFYYGLLFKIYTDL